MSNYIDAFGLHTDSLSDIISDLQASFLSIYGADVSTDPNSPDAQMIALFAQAKIDILDCLTQIYNSFSPSTATGISLDQRCAINGVVRTAATYSTTYVTVTTDRILTLPGLDLYPTAPFTVADTNNNQYYLETTTTTTAGSNSLIFIAANAGAVSVGTINAIITITLGVLTVATGSIINTGVDEETDAQLRLRREAAVSVPSAGFLDGLVGALKQVSNVTDAVVYENVTSTTDANSVPGHSIWAIVDGGTAADIAQVIYNKRNAGCGMKGSVVTNITQVNGSTLAVQFDLPVYQNLWCTAVLNSMSLSHTIDTAYITAQIYANFVYSIYENADFSAITAFIKQLDPLAVVSSGGVSNDGVNYYNYLAPTTKQNRFIFPSAAAPYINITAV